MGVWTTASRARTAAAVTAAVSAAAVVAVGSEVAGTPPATAHAKAQTVATAAGPCAATPRPTGRTVAWFNRPGVGAPTPITRGLVDTICGAAPGSTIRIAVFFVFPGSTEVNTILSALRTVQRERGVRVMFVVDRSMYKLGRGPAMLRTLRQLATVVTCSQGCRNAGRGGVAHNKFLVVNDTVWQPGADPVVVQSTANWSVSQLRSYHQSAVMLWDDARIAREMTIRWDSLRVCGAVGCQEWNRQLRQRGLNPATYRIQRVADVWVDAALGERSGTPGRGTRVSFTPTARGDLVAGQLGSFRCTRSHRTVRVAEMQVTRPAVINALDALQARRCSVRVLVAADPDPRFVAGVAAMRRAGLRVSCVRRLHHKHLLVDAVLRGTHAARRVLWVGSQNLGFSGLRRSDNTMLRLAPATAGPGARPELARVLDRFTHNFRILNRQTVRCPSR